MATIIQPSDTIRLYATFIDVDPSGEEVPVSVDYVNGEIFKWDGSGWVSQGTFNPVADVNPGTFFHDWTPGSEGLFRTVFTATIQINNKVTDAKDIYVGSFTANKFLGKDLTYEFSGELTPFYVDPESILAYYPDGDPSEIAEMIFRYSKIVENLVGESPIREFTSLMEEFIMASVLCELSRIYMYEGGLTGFSRADSFTLGDLNVRSSDGTGNRGNFYGTNREPASWCELAAFLRERLRSSRVRIKSYVKAGNHLNPIKTRELRRFE